MKLDLMYYYGNTAEQYSFYRIPKALFTDSHYQGVSLESKMLYGLMLDRMGLSVRNGWMDSDGKVYIYFTLEDAMKMMGWGHNKGVKHFSELEQIGLIERVKQGFGRPAQIYVKNFILPVDPVPQPDAEHFHSPASSQTSDFGKSGLPHSQEVLTSEFRKSVLPENGSQDFPKKEANKTDKNKTDLSDTETTSTSLPPAPRRRQPVSGRGRRMEEYRTVIRENISCDILVQDYGCDPEQVNSCVELMAEVCSSTRDTLRINQEQLPIELVRSRFLKLDMTHIAYVLDFLSHNTTPVGNVRGYMLSVLYNAPTIMEQYYASQVNHDMAQRREAGG